jgi:hypothetical protein
MPHTEDGSTPLDTGFAFFAKMAVAHVRPLVQHDHPVGYNSLRGPGGQGAGIVVQCASHHQRCPVDRQI